MPDDDATLHAARRAVRQAQEEFERESAATQRARHKAFAEAHKAGLTHREIAEQTGLHHTTVGEIIRGR